MPDRVKAAIFSMLGSYYDLPGTLPPIRVADVFAGSGSMGLEALSRGAASCYFFEQQRMALERLRENLNRFEVGEQATIVTRDAWRASLTDADERPFELVLLDPPYKDSTDSTSRGKVRKYLARLAAIEEASPLIMLHHQAPKEWVFDNDEPWRVLDHRTFGTNAVTMIAR